MGRFRNYLLPVPILPGYLAFIFFNLTTYGIVRFKTETEPVLFGWLRAWLEACIPAAVLAAFLYIAAHAVNFSLKKITSARKRKYFYYFGLFIISIAYTLSQSLTDPDLPDLSSRAYFRNFVHLFVAVALIGTLYVNMRREIEEKMAALTLVQAQNKVLIESEERSRATVANFLHDRVQTALVTVTMQLSEIALIKQHIKSPQTLQTLKDGDKTLVQMHMQSMEKLHNHLADWTKSTLIYSMRIQMPKTQAVW